MGKINNNKKLSNDLEVLTSTEKAIIWGSLLGDAHLQKKTSETYRVRILHSTAQKDLVLWKYKHLERLCKTTQQPKLIPNNQNEAYAFYTSSLSLFKETHSLFYKEVPSPTENNPNKVKYVKTISQELIDQLPMDPLVLAVFYLDDGSVRTDCYSAKIATQSFSLEEQELLVQYFKKWNISVNITTHIEKSSRYGLSIPAKSFGAFIEIIEPIVKEIPSLTYKLNEKRRPRND